MTNSEALNDEWKHFLRDAAAKVFASAPFSVTLATHFKEQRPAAVTGQARRRQGYGGLAGRRGPSRCALLHIPTFCQ
jgi:hypothetical protein